jgi:hypothetical protein
MFLTGRLRKIPGTTPAAFAARTMRARQRKAPKSTAHLRRQENVLPV